MNKKNSKRFMVICLGTVLGFTAANVLYEWNVSRNQPDFQIEQSDLISDYQIMAAEMPDKHCPYLPHRCLSKEAWEFNDCFERWLNPKETPCPFHGDAAWATHWLYSVYDHCELEVMEGRKIAAELVAEGREGNGYCLVGVESAAETLRYDAKAEAKQSRLIAPHIEQ